MPTLTKNDNAPAAIGSVINHMSGAPQTPLLVTHPGLEPGTP